MFKKEKKKRLSNLIQTANFGFHTHDNDYNNIKFG